jgi:hypothetical protein
MSGEPRACPPVVLWGPKLCRGWDAKATLSAVLDKALLPPYLGLLAMWKVGSGEEEEFFLGPMSAYVDLFVKNQLDKPTAYLDFAGKPVVVIQADEYQQVLVDPEIKQLVLPPLEGIKFEGGDVGCRCEFDKEGIEYSGVIVARKPTISYVLTDKDNNLLDMDITCVKVKVFRDQLAARPGTATSVSRNDAFRVVPCKALAGAAYNLYECFGVLMTLQNGEAMKKAVDVWGKTLGFIQDNELHQEPMEVDTFRPCLQLKKGPTDWAAELGFMWTHISCVVFFVRFDSDPAAQMQKLSTSDVSVDDSNVVTFDSDNIRYFSVLPCHTEKYAMEVKVHDGDTLKIETRVNGKVHLLRLLANPLDKQTLDKILGLQFPMKVTQKQNPSQLKKVGQEVLDSSDAGVQFQRWLTKAAAVHALQGDAALSYAVQQYNKRKGKDDSAAPIDAADDTSTGALKPGAEVFIHSLTKSPGLNGQHAVVVQKIETSDGVRWEVQLTDGSKKSCKPENLLVVAQASSSGAGGRGAGGRAAGARAAGSRATKRKEADTGHTTAGRGLWHGKGAGKNGNDEIGSFSVCSGKVLDKAFEEGWICYDQKEDTWLSSVTFNKRDDDTNDEFLLKCLVNLLVIDGNKAKINTAMFQRLKQGQHITFDKGAQKNGGFRFTNQPCQACKREFDKTGEMPPVGGRPSMRFQINLHGPHTESVANLLDQYFQSENTQFTLEENESSAAVAAMRSESTKVGK